MLFGSQTADTVGRAIAASRVSGLVAVLDDSRLARALAAEHSVVAIAGAVRDLRRAAEPKLCADLRRLPIRDDALAAIVGAGVGKEDEWRAVIAGWARALQDGGLVVMVDKAPAEELSRRALCGGLSDIEQHHAGRTVVTWGKVRKLPALATDANGEAEHDGERERAGGSGG